MLSDLVYGFDDIPPKLVTKCLNHLTKLRFFFLNFSHNMRSRVKQKTKNSKIQLPTPTNHSTFEH